MDNINLRHILNWMEYELECGSRVKANKLYKLFCKYARIRFSKVTEERLKNYNNYYWGDNSCREPDWKL